MSPRSRRGIYARRRKRRMAQNLHDLTEDQWVALRSAWGGCAYCGADDPQPQKDCILPISRGGRYTLSNVVPACGSCNASKCNSEVTTWMRRKGLDESAFLWRQAEITRMVAAAETTRYYIRRSRFRLHSVGYLSPYDMLCGR